MNEPCCGWVKDNQMEAVEIQSKPDARVKAIQTIENAGHYSLITPFPDKMKKNLGAVAQDLVEFQDLKIQ